jgi:hypothetical protein
LLNKEEGSVHSVTLSDFNSVFFYNHTLFHYLKLIGWIINLAVFSHKIGFLQQFTYLSNIVTIFTFRGNETLPAMKLDGVTFTAGL